MVVAACSTAPNDGPPCEVVAAQFYATSRTASERVPDEALRRTLDEQLPAWRDQLARSCRAGNWSPGARLCFAEAVDRVSFDACTRQLTDEQRTALESWYTVRTH